MPDVIDFTMLHREVHSVVGSACLRFLNASHYHLPRATRESYRSVVLQQRDSVLYRFESLSFHLSLLGNSLEKYASLIGEEGPTDRTERAHLRAAANEALYLLDDIVFNSASMFDYWAGLVAAIFLGPHRHTIKWNNLRRTLSGSATDRPSAGEAFLVDSSSARRILHLHGEWVDALFAYRSDVIHTSAEKADGAIVRTWRPEHSVELQIPLPAKLRRRMAYLLEDDPEEGLALLGGARLYMRCFYGLTDLALSLASDVDDRYGRWHPFRVMLN